MADIKVIYKNADGLDNEHSESADSIKLLSLKTANNELTDAKLGRLVDGSDAADEHIHDARYFRENEHINASVGAGDAEKPVVTDAFGKLSTTFLDIPAIEPLLDHGGLTGLGDDDHTQYLKTDGSRDLTGIQSYAVHPSFGDDKQLVDKKYVDDLFAGDEWLSSADDRLITPPLTPATGFRVLIDASMGSPTGAFVGKDNQVAQWNGSVWTYQIPTAGTYISVDDEITYLYVYDGAAWNAKAFEASTASDGLVKVGNDIRIDAGAAGDGLSFTSGVIDVNVDGTSIEISGDSLRVAAAGIKETMIDFGTGAGQVSGADIPLADAGSYFTTDNVESALQQLAGDIQQQGVSYTVAAGGVVKGDLVYITSVNTVTKLSTITQNEYCIGLALSTVSAAGAVKVLANDTLLTGVLTGAAAGDRVYWNGSGPSFTIPTGGGSNVWSIGVAKNATDLHVEIEHVKKNS